MTILHLAEPRAARAVERLSPYVRSSLERSAELALHLHADEVAPEHVLVTLLGDEDAGATRMVVHAFADPETIAGEVVALCPGILVVGAARSLPFSVQGVCTLEAARGEAARRAVATVTPAFVAWAAAGALHDEGRRVLDELGYDPGFIDRLPLERSSSPVPPDGPLFKRFNNDARRAMANACRQATARNRDAIGPIHALLACLELDEGLRTAIGLTPSRVRQAFGEHDADPTRPEARPLAPAPELVELLASLAEGADTMELLGGFLRHGSEEMRLLLIQQQINLRLHERSRGAFRDPEAPGAALGG